MLTTVECQIFTNSRENITRLARDVATMTWEGYGQVTTADTARYSAAALDDSGQCKGRGPASIVSRCIGGFHGLKPWSEAILSLSGSKSVNPAWETGNLLTRATVTH